MSKNLDLENSIFYRQSEVIFFQPNQYLYMCQGSVYTVCPLLQYTVVDCTAIQCILVVIVFLGGLVGIFQWTHRFCNSEFRCKIELLVSYTDIVD